MSAAKRTNIRTRLLRSAVAVTVVSGVVLGLAAMAPKPTGGSAGPWNVLAMLGLGGGDSARARNRRAEHERVQAALDLMDTVSSQEVDEATQQLIDDGLYDPNNADSLRVGQLAPDFELMPLRMYDYQMPRAQITKANAGSIYDPVQLSAFRDNLPVVLIFGSYT